MPHKMLLMGIRKLLILLSPHSKHLALKPLSCSPKACGLMLTLKLSRLNYMNTFSNTKSGSMHSLLLRRKLLMPTRKVEPQELEPMARRRKVEVAPGSGSHSPLSLLLPLACSSTPKVAQIKRDRKSVV